MRIPALVKLHEKFHQNSTFGSKIVGGNEATPHSYPHQVGIFIDGGFFCGGSLIGLCYTYKQPFELSRKFKQLLYRLDLIQNLDKLLLQLDGVFHQKTLNS